MEQQSKEGEKGWSAVYGMQYTVVRRRRLGWKIYG
jgi:hypothetical protein